MSDKMTIIVTILVNGDHLIKWLLIVTLNDVYDEYHDLDFKKVMKELVKKQPQMADTKIMEVERADFEIA